MSHKDGTVTVNGHEYQIVTLDYETYYDKEYTLSSKTMNTSEYIRDARFHAHGIGIKIGNGKTLWYTGVNIGLALKQIDWTKSAMLAHNAPFDGFIASQIYDVIPAFYLDTLSMARAVHGHHTRHDLDTIAKAHGLKGKVKRAALADTKGKLELTPAESAALGGYCVNDTDDTYEIFWKMYDQIPDDELELIDMTCRMFCDPVLKVDGPRAEAELHKEIGSKAAAMLVSGADVSSLLSNQKFAELLKAAGYNPPMKVSPATGKLTYAFAKTDEGFKELARSANPKIAALCEARLKVKSTIGETRAVRLIEAGKDGMSLPVLLNYSGAHTHRWSGSNKMNMQNFKRGGELRKSIIAPDGHVIVVADSAQIEARVLAWLAGQLDLLEAFRQKRDVYSEFATKAYNKPINRKLAAKNEKGEFLNEDGDVVASYEEAFKPYATEGFVGKTCVAADTLVLTRRGWVPILYVTDADYVWDGIEWVTTDGPIFQGYKETETAHGLTATPDHKVLTGDSWEEWRAVRINPTQLRSALSSVTLPLSIGSTTIGLGTHSYAAHAPQSTSSTDTISSKANQHAATSVQKSPETVSATSNTAKSYPMKIIASAYLIASRLVSNAARILKTPITSIMDSVVSAFIQNGSKIAENFFDTSSHYLTGMFPRLNLTALTAMQDIYPETCASFQEAITSGINAKSQILKQGSVTSNQNLPVYDLLNCGPRTRFTVLSSEGPLIISNCVLGLGYGMGHIKLRATLKSGAAGPSVEMSENECKRIVNTYRAVNSEISNLWKKMDGVIAAMLTGAVGELGPLTYGKGYIQLPNGLFLQYYGLHGNAEIRRSDLVVNEASYLTRNGRAKIYGGLLTENVVQALARIIIGEQMLAIQKLGYRIVMMSHDEIVAVCPESQGTQCLEDMIKIMSTPPSWALDLPLAAEGGIDVMYSK